MKNLKYFFILSVLTFSSCCSSKNLSLRCECKDFNKFVKDYWIQDKETRKNYIDSENANMQISPIEEFENLVTKCWNGKSFKELQKLLPPPTNKNNRQGLTFLFYPSKKTLDCKEKKMDCSSEPLNSLNIQVQFNSKINGVIKRAEVHTITRHGGGELSIELYDFTIEDLLKMKEKEN